MVYTRSLLLSGAAVVLISSPAKQPYPPTATPTISQDASSPTSSSSSKSAKHKHTPFDDFLIRGTVFNDEALAFPGVEVRVRLVGEKKFRWQDVTNSRGNFAFRVPHDASYEVVTHAKGFLDQSETVVAKTGSTDQNLSFKMQPTREKK
jgi:hypothetical protein